MVEADVVPLTGVQAMHEQSIRRYDKPFDAFGATEFGLVSAAVGSAALAGGLPKYQAPDLAERTVTLNKLNASMNEASRRLFGDIFESYETLGQFISEQVRIDPTIKADRGLGSLSSSGPPGKAMVDQWNSLNRALSNLTGTQSREDFTAEDVHNSLNAAVRGGGKWTLPNPLRVNTEKLPITLNSASRYNAAVSEFDQELKSVRTGYAEAYRANVRTMYKAVGVGLASVAANATMDLTLFRDKSDSHFALLTDLGSQLAGGFLARKFGPAAMLLPIATHAIEKLTVERTT
jgi:hypothetical protein